jgi:putative transcriptional regulator
MPAATGRLEQSRQPCNAKVHPRVIFLVPLPVRGSPGRLWAANWGPLWNWLPRCTRGMTLTELADRVGLTLSNLSVLKNGRARAIRFSTLSALCQELRCQPGDLMSVRLTR